MARSGRGTWIIQLKPLKQELLDPRAAAIVADYVKALPEGPVLKGGTDSLDSYLERPSNIRPEQMERMLDRELAKALAALPDQIETEADGSETPNFWTGRSLPDIGGFLASSALIGLVASLGFVFALALLASPTWPGRAAWSGGVLLVPAIMVLLVGVVGRMVSDAALVGGLGTWLAGEIHIQGGEAMQPAMASMIREMLGTTLKTVTQGFLWTGLVSIGVCVALISFRRLERRGPDSLDD
jgi:hypothetical protein